MLASSSRHWCRSSTAPRPWVVLLFLFLGLWPAALATETGTVVAVIDGDTIDVELSDGVERIRLIGVDTPETVHPWKEVERYGKEASAFTRRLASGKLVRLEPDPDTADRDRYGRLLRYVYIIDDGALINAEIIGKGYGHAYTKYPFTKMEEFRALERTARVNEMGLWAPGGTKLETDNSRDDSAEPSSSPGFPTTVYVTKTGTKYHREHCKHLARSTMELSLDVAKQRGYEPCGECRP